MKKILPLIIVAIVLVGAGGFYGGMKYGASRQSASGGLTNFRNLSPEERQQRFQQMGGTGSGNRQAGDGLVNGEIIAKDDKSVTVKLRDGGSKIIFYSASTEIGKFVSGTPNDLEIGEIVMVSGTVNQDGSLTASSIQVRPALPNQP